VTARRIGILGGGISGISLAAHLGDNVEILEKRQRTGGLCGSIIENGYTFDAAGPHIMFSKNKEVLAHMIEVLGDNVHERRRENKIWFRDRLVKYPFENDLASLSKEDTYECILGYLRNPYTKEPENLEEWSYATFGKGISEKYFLPYNRKIWNYDPAKITLEWVSRIPKPPMEDVLKSAIGIPTEGYLHQLYFHYPIRGGYEALVHAFEERVRGTIDVGWSVANVERVGDEWRVTSTRGETREYDTLVSTLPIHELMKVWPEAPPAAREALSRLRYNSLINVLVGTNEDREIPYTAVYIADPDVPFHRVSFPRNFSEETVPAGHTAMMAEITTNEGDGVWELSDDEVIERTLAALERMQFVDRTRVDYTRVVRFQYGYPVYDLTYREEVTRLRTTVADAGIHLLGRFAQFDYINSDVCIERALALAKQLAT
jgi:protoporphyrinogen oxidase